MTIKTTIAMIVGTFLLLLGCDDNSKRTDSCGNGTLDPGEVCDGEELAGVTCSGLGFYGGALACRADCTLDQSGCEAAGRCGDGILQESEGESCEGGVEVETGCPDRGLFFGQVVCDEATCRLDDSQCSDFWVWGSTSPEIVPIISRGPSGGLYVAGSTIGAFEGQTWMGWNDVFLSRFDRDGTLLWTRQWGSYMEDHPDVLLVDPEGNALIGCNTSGPMVEDQHLGQTDVVFIKCDQDGNLVWMRQWGSAQGEGITQMFMEADGSFQVIGRTSGSLGDDHSGNFDLDQYWAKFDRDGNRLWTQQWDVAAGAGLNSVVYSENGFYMAGMMASGNVVPGQEAYGDDDGLLVRVDLYGQWLWARQWGTDKRDYVVDLALGSDGDLYVVGTTQGEFEGAVPTGDYDLFLARFTAQGDRVWIRQMGTFEDDFANKVVLLEGELWILGSTRGVMEGNKVPGDLDFFLARVNADGEFLEVRQWGSLGFDAAEDMVVTEASQLIITGYTDGGLDVWPEPYRSEVFLFRVPW